jgi:hypothetical protein
VIIKPIYKNKGDVKDSMIYRPITIVGCLGKLFTAILNARLKDYTEEFMMLKENQSGFRQSYEIHGFTLAYILNIILYILPFMLLSNNL